MEQTVVFRNAIALNNVGVQLLTKQCYGQAIDTLRDALEVMKVAMHEYGNSSIDELNRSEAIEKYSMAMQRLNHPNVCQVHETLTLNVLLASNVCCDYKQAVTADLSSTTLFPIHIDDMDFTYESDTDVDFETSIVLNNMAIANLCMSKCMSSLEESSSSEYLKCSLQLFRLSHEVFSSALIETEEDECPFTNPDLFQKHAIILSSWIKTLKSSPSCHHHELEENLCAKLNHLRVTVSDIEEVNIMMFGYHDAQAAAAA